MIIFGMPAPAQTGGPLAVLLKTLNPDIMRPLIISSLFGLILTLVCSCQIKDHLRTGEGFINVKGGKIWYKVSGDGSNIPMVMLHGGPGFPSYYLNPLLALSKDRPVILFDQLGCGRSDRITDTSLMTIENYIAQLRTLLSELKITEFYLYGHSWGTMLAMDYYFKYPNGIKALILASPCTNIRLWMNDADTLISTLPDSIGFYIRQNIKNIKSDSAKMREAIDLYYDSFYTRKKPITADVDSSRSQFGINVYEYMWGKEEFYASGTLKDYDKTGDLDKIIIPSLYITGEFDAARPNTVKGTSNNYVNFL